ncbi:hypothetical protein ACFL2V_17635 [Pseudomonadota bacterium]
MLEFLKKSLGLGQRAEAANHPQKQGIDCQAIYDLMRYFPIGTKVHYYPEYHKDIMMDTVLVAYWINGELVYSTQEVTFNNDILVFNDRGSRKSYKDILSFHFVVPIVTDEESKLDYGKREELSRVGGMARGNILTLIAEKNAGQVPVLEAEVNKRAMLRDGLYANQHVALLDVDVNSLALTDQRSHLRLQTNVPVSLQIPSRGQAQLFSCRMKDFSDCSLRIEIDPDVIGEYMPEEGDSLIVSFRLPNCPDMIAITVNVFRVTGNSLVMAFTGRVDQGRTHPLSQIDILNVKANLLQHCHADVME